MDPEILLEKSLRMSKTCPDRNRYQFLLSGEAKHAWQHMVVNGAGVGAVDPINRTLYGISVSLEPSVNNGVDIDMIKRQ